MATKDDIDVPAHLTRQLLDAWRDYKVACSAVQKCLIDDERMGYQGQAIDHDGVPVNAFSTAAKMYTEFEREAGDDARRSNIAYGVIVVSSKTQGAIELLNKTKKALTEVIQDLKNHGDVTLEAIKASAKLTRLHYFKILRPVKGLDGHRPESVRLSVEQKIDTQRRTVDECMEKLEEFGAIQPHIQVQLDALAKIKKTEHLAYVYETQNVRCVANISFAKHRVTNRREHTKLRSVMPFYVVSQDPEWAPDIRLPSTVRLEDRLARQERSDRKIDPQPFLPSLHVHRYI